MPITECPECFEAAHTGYCPRRPDNHFYSAPFFVTAGVWPRRDTSKDVPLSAAEIAYHLDADGDLAGYDGA